MDLRQDGRVPTLRSLLLGVLRGALLACCVVVAAATPAAAHASLVGSDPADGAVLASAPATVTLRFDEPVDVVPGGFSLRGPAGDAREVAAQERGASARARLPQGLGQGTYVLSWRVVSDDGHPLAGALTFSIGAPTPGRSAAAQLPSAGAVPTVQAVVHGVDYAALLVAGGLCLFVLWTARDARLAPPVRRRLQRVVEASAAVAIVSSALAVPLAGAYRLGVGLTDLPGAVVDGSAIDPDLVGGEVLVLGAQALGLAVAVWALRRGQAPSVGIGVAVAAAVVSPAVVGHTRAYEPSSLLVLTDALHLAAGATWLGGLAGLALALPTLAGRPRDAAALLARFSGLAAGLLVAVAVTGTLQAWRILGSWSLLLDDTYGRLLLAKVAIAGLVALVAGLNRWRLLPRVAGDGGHAERQRAGRLVARAVAAEAVGLVVLLGVTGFLTQAAPEGTGDVGVTAPR